MAMRKCWMLGAGLTALLLVGSCDRLEDILKGEGGGGHAGVPRLTAPLSASISTTRQPVFQWTGATKVHIEVCRDRACTQSLASFQASGSSARAPAPLPAGTVFWRASGSGEASATWQLRIPARDSGRAASWGAVPDFNGDGYSDLAVGSQIAGAPGGADLRLFPGGSSGPPQTPSQTIALGPAFAFSVEPAGDLDGDGFCDLAAWNLVDPAFGNGPSVTIFRGGPAGLSASISFAAPVATSEQPNLASAGDVNADGYGDLWVGGQTAAELFLGGPGGLATTPALSVAAANPATPNAMDPLPGDFNGDGKPDVIAAGYPSALLYLGAGLAFTPDPGVSFPGPFTFLAGDVNGDGITDVGSRTLLVGGPGGLTPFLSLDGISIGSTMGDVDGDGYGDVLAGVATSVSTLEHNRVYFGGTNPCAATSCARFAPLLVPGSMNDGTAQVPIESDGVGDLNGDGYDDVMFHGPFPGEVMVFYGSASGPALNPSLTLIGDPGFGYAVAGLAGL